MPPPAPTPTRARLADSARRVAPFQWKVLTVFLVIGLVGSGVYAAAWFNRPAPTPAPVAGTESRAPVAVTPPGGSSGFVRGTTDTTDARVADAPPAEAAAPAVRDTWTGWAGAKGATLGFGFVGGFVVGFVFRAFLKIMTLATVVIVGGLTLLSYYNVLNIDTAAARDAVQSNAGWLTDQATRLKDLVIAHLPSTTGGAAGAFFGLRRR